jgi:hypothetical protein
MMLLPKIRADVKRATFLGPLYKSISSAFPRSLAAFDWIFVSAGGAYSDRTAGGSEAFLGIEIGVAFCMLLGFDTNDETGGGRLGVVARKGVVCVKDLTCVALLRSSLRSGCKDIVFFCQFRTEMIAGWSGLEGEMEWKSLDGGSPVRLLGTFDNRLSI